MENLWVAVFFIYAAPADSAVWPGQPWRQGMPVAEEQAFFHSEADCRDYAAQKIGRENILASMGFQCVEFPDGLRNGAPF